jgi:GMP synthase (glutamine-hydrolysing)
VSRAASILVLQHIGCEPAAAYEDELRHRGLRALSVMLHEGQQLPDARDVAGIIAMGGPMGAYDDAGHPWLADEKRFIADAVRAGTPYWGVCLGAQLLAASLGARVMPGDRPEVGIAPVTLTVEAASDPVFCDAPRAFEVLHWHGDTYELPPGAARLAGSAQYEQQAFVVGRAYGLQFHLEVSAVLAREWLQVPAYADSVRQAGGERAGAQLVDRLAAAQPQMSSLARSLLGRWLRLVVAVQPGPRRRGSDA